MNNIKRKRAFYSAFITSGAFFTRRKDRPHPGLRLQAFHYFADKRRIMILYENGAVYHHYIAGGFVPFSSFFNEQSRQGCIFSAAIGNKTMICGDNDIEFIGKPAGLQGIQYTLKLLIYPGKRFMVKGDPTPVAWADSSQRQAVADDRQQKEPLTAHNSFNLRPQGLAFANEK